MKKGIIGLNALLIIALCVANYFLLSPGPGPSKAFCSGLFAALGAINALYVLLHGGKRAFALVMAAGLVLAMQGDVMINGHFIRGASLFAAGHACFWLAYCLLARPRWMDGLCTGLVFVPIAAYLILSRRLVFIPSGMRWVCVGYAFVISLMTGKAISNFWYKPDWLTGILLAGSVLFCFSDLMLLLDLFRGYGRLFGLLCMGTYYPAELLLAHGIYHAAGKRYSTTI